MKNSSRFFALLLAPAAALALGLPARADVSMSDKTFVKKAAIDGMFEVQTGKLAQDKGSSQAVKDFGAKMVEDHGKANDELKSIASSKNIDVPTALDSKHQKMYDSLNGMSGKAFDKAYLADMTKGHAAADDLMKTEASSGSDSDLKSFASKTDQTVKMHISMLNDIKSKM